MAGSSQSELECLKILLLGLYVEILVSAYFLCVKSDLLWFTFGDKLVPLSSYMLIIVHTETTKGNGLGHRRSPKN